MSDNICSCVCYQDYIIQLEEAQDKIDELHAREAKLQKALQDIIDMYGENLPAGEIALAAIGQEKK
jgi:hypothetical protein